jgi:hypothetical protein
MATSPPATSRTPTVVSAFVPVPVVGRVPEVVADRTDAGGVTGAAFTSGVVVATAVVG